MPKKNNKADDIFASGFYFVPLGGCGEIGMNLNLYCVDGKWIMVDLGMTFANDYYPGIDLIVPDPIFIEERRDDLLGIVLTHGHEDHIGAIPYLWQHLRAPLYATPFTAELIRGKLIEAGIEDEVELNILNLGDEIQLGKFLVTYTALAHSIAEGNALQIDTPYGKVFHTGDWKLDEKPLIGRPASPAELTEIGDGSVLAMIGDSTNVFNAGRSGSEGDVRDSLKSIIGDLKGRVIITTFASNVARLETIGEIAKALGREIGVLGRSMHRVISIARSCGYLANFPRILEEHEFDQLPDDNLLILCTGCQGEGRAVLTRIAEGNFPAFSIEAGDTVIFSSKIIPGNEVSIGRLINALTLADAHVITEKDAFVHVSGHPGQSELADMYSWIRPKVAIPVHGEARHLKKHAEFAKSCGIEKSLVVLNGDVIQLAPEPVKKSGVVEIGRLLLDGTRLIPADSETIAERRRMSFNGHLTIALGMDGKGNLTESPHCVALGIPDWYEGGELHGGCIELVDDVLSQLHPKNRLDVRLVEEEIRRLVRRYLFEETDKKVIVAVRVVQAS